MTGGIKPAYPNRRLALALLAWGVLAPAALSAPETIDPAKVPPGTYVLDRKHAGLIAKVPHMGFSRYMMRFDRLGGGFTYDPAAWAATVVRIEVEAASVDTGSESFDKQIAGFFDADKHPKIVFVSRGLEAVDGASGKLAGELTFHGVTKPVSLDVTFNGAGPGMMGTGTRLGFSGSGRIKRSDFGVTAHSTLVGDEVDLVFEVEFYKS